MKQLHLFSLPRPIICTYRVKQGYRTALIDIILFSSVIGAYKDTRNWTLLFVLLGPELSASGRSTCVLCVHFLSNAVLDFVVWPSDDTTSNALGQQKSEAALNSQKNIYIVDTHTHRLANIETL